MSMDFIVSEEYQGYVYVGNAQGNFVNDKGVKQSFCNIFVVSPVSTYQSEDFQAHGFKAEKLKCASSEVWRDLDIGTRVKLFFDAKKVCVMAVIDQ